MPDSKVLPPRRRIARLPDPPRRPPVALIASAAAVALVAFVWLALRRPAPAAPDPSPTPVFVPEPKRSPEPERRDALDELLADARRQIDARRYGAAMRLLDEFPARQCPRSDAEEKIAALRAEAESKARALCAERATEAESLATAGRLREAVDRLADLAELDTPSLLAPAFDRLRRAADGWLAARRSESRLRMEKELADLAARYDTETAAANPEEAWKVAEAMIEAGDWASAIRPLTRLAKDPAWRERALVARSRAHYASDQFVGVLLDARLMIDAGVPAGRALAMLPRAVTRAPIDDLALQLYERAVEKQPRQPDAWMCLAVLHTWRHDAASAARVTDRAIEKRVRFDGESLGTMTVFQQLRERGFPHGRPVYVDYVGPYEILTDTSPKRARELADQLDGIAREYTALLPYARNPNLRFRVMLFANDYDFNEYHRACFGRTARDSGAGAYYFSPIKQLVVPNDHREVAGVVRHEAYHQFLDWFVRPPRWLNEGTACVMERSAGGRCELSKRYIDGAAECQSVMRPMRAVMQTNPGDWEGPISWVYYCQSSTFIYYLRRNGRGALLDEYLRLQILGWAEDEAFRRAFAKADFDELERGWRGAVATGNY